MFACIYINIIVAPPSLVPRSKVPRRRTRFICTYGTIAPRIPRPPTRPVPFRRRTGRFARRLARRHWSRALRRGLSRRYSHCDASSSMWTGIQTARHEKYTLIDAQVFRQTTKIPRLFFGRSWPSGYTQHCLMQIRISCVESEREGG